MPIGEPLGGDPAADFANSLRATNPPLAPTMTTGMSVDHTHDLPPVVFEFEVLVKSDKLTLSAV